MQRKPHQRAQVVDLFTLDQLLARGQAALDRSDLPAPTERPATTYRIVMLNECEAEPITDYLPLPWARRDLTTLRANASARYALECSNGGFVNESDEQWL